MGQFSLTHLLLLAVIVLLFFGPSRLPQLGKSLGKAIRGFKDGISGKDSPPSGTKEQAVKKEALNSPERDVTEENETTADRDRQG